MPVVASQLLLVLALAAVGAASLRIAALTGARALERGLAAVAIGATIVVLESLALGLVRLGTSPGALAGAAVATWLVTLRLVPAAGPRVAGALAARLGRGGLRAAGVIAGLTLAWIAWVLRHPYIGFDGLTYHLGTVILWIHGHRPGAQTPLFQGVPVENYPLSLEVMLTWLSALARSYAPAVIAMVAFVALAGTAGWALLRRLHVDAAAAALAVLAFVALPTVAGFANTVNTDVPAVAWLLCAAALAAAARERPALLAPALLAGGLCLGTKTTPGPLLVAALGAGMWTARAHVRPLIRPLGLAAAAALVAGGLWYVRNLLQHGSPLWPFIAAPWGDPKPSALVPVAPSFISHPREMLRGNVDAYLRTMAGGTVLLGAILAVPALARSRRALTLAGLTAVGLFAWMCAPYTGILHPPVLAAGATRYLLATYAAGCVALALAAADGGRIGRPLALSLLGASAIWSLVRLYGVGFPMVPSASTLIVGALAGAAGALALRAAAGKLALATRRRAGGAVIAALLAAVMVAGLTAGAHGFSARHAATGAEDATFVRFLEAGGDAGRRTIWMTPGVDAVAAGDRLQRTLHWFPFTTPCARVREHALHDLVVLPGSRFPGLLRGLTGCLRAAPRFATPNFTVLGGA